MQELKNKYEKDEQVLAIEQLYQEYDVDCIELEEATGRDVLLQM